MIFLIVLISLSLLILVHELGHFLAAKISGVKVEEFGFGFPPRLFGKKIGETIYSLNLLPFGGFVRLCGEDKKEKMEPEEEKKSFGYQTVSRRSFIILSGVSMNIVLGWLVFSVLFMIGQPHHLILTDVMKDSPAEAASLKKGDIILKAVFQDIVLTDPIKSEIFIDLVKKSKDEITFKIKRENKIFETKVKGRENPPPGEGPIGVGLLEVGFDRLPLWQSLIKSASLTFSTMALITKSFGEFILKLFVSPKVLETVAGPVGIFALATEAGKNSLLYLAQLMAFISLNLAVLNLIPFPALDGGRFLFLIIEKIKGAPPSLRLLSIINTLGFIALITLMVLVTISDVEKILK